MALSRYSFIDEYTREELTREYASSDTTGRLRLLERLRDDVPYEITERAASDPAVIVRQWIARHGTRFVACARPASSSASNGHENLKHLLSNDPDPFVRACLRENPSACYPFQVRLETMSQLERLATLRNPEFSLLNTEALRRIFDFDDHTLGISVDQRSDLIRALLTNAKFLGDTHKRHYEFGFDENTDMIWTLASKWPKETFVPHLVYRHFGLPRGVVISSVIDHADNDIVASILDNESVSGSVLWKCKLRLIALGKWKSAFSTFLRGRWKTRTLTTSQQKLDELKSQRVHWLIILLIVLAIEFMTRRLDRFDVYLFSAGFSLVVLSWIVERSARAIVAGLEELACKSVPRVD